MDTKRRRAVVALFLVLAIGNYLRMFGSGPVNGAAFWSVFAIGLLAGILITDTAHLYRSNREDKNKMV
jgi:hypothetical protein